MYLLKFEFIMKSVVLSTMWTYAVTFYKHNNDLFIYPLKILIIVIDKIISFQPLWTYILYLAILDTHYFL